MIILLVNSGFLQAQIRPGYIIGINRSTLEIKSADLTKKPETITGIHFGGALDIPINKNISFQPNLLFTAKGSNFTFDSTEYSLSPIYVEIPVYLVFSTGSDYIRLQLSAGSYVACGVGGYKIVSGGQLQDLRYGSGSEKDLRTFDAGFNFGAGIYFGGFVISVRYEIGLPNLMPSSSPATEMKNKVLGISLSSLFIYQ